MQPTNKCSFILRLWRENQNKTAGWLASLENPESGKRLGFAGLEQLFAFLIDFTEIKCDLQPMEKKATENHKTPLD